MSPHSHIATTTPVTPTPNAKPRDSGIRISNPFRLNPSGTNAISHFTIGQKIQTAGLGPIDKKRSRVDDDSTKENSTDAEPARQRARIDHDLLPLGLSHDGKTGYESDKVKMVPTFSSKQELYEKKKCVDLLVHSGNVKCKLSSLSRPASGELFTSIQKPIAAEHVALKLYLSTHLSMNIFVMRLLRDENGDITGQVCLGELDCSFQQQRSIELLISTGHEVRGQISGEPFKYIFNHRMTFSVEYFTRNGCDVKVQYLASHENVRSTRNDLLKEKEKADKRYNA